MAILMDVILPDGSGKDLVRAIKQDERNKNIPIIFTTNILDVVDDKGQALFVIDGQQYCAFAKPLHRERFIYALRKEINRSESGDVLPKKFLE
ncbi:MAG: CheY-like chemotaxis protein [Lysobacterales bacterium]|jgi:CheY-like chemotaxis protein